MNRILVVDDDALIRRMLSDWLLKEGYLVNEASNAYEAIRIIRKDPPDLIVLDLVLPDMSGIALCGLIRTDEQTMRIPIVMLTGAGSSEDRIRGLESGSDEFLSKPVERVELIARVRTLLRSKNLSDRLLISYHEIDKLGSFAETFITQPVADWSREDVAISMARQVLGHESGLPGHPSLMWGAFESRGIMIGLLTYYEGQKWMQERTEFSYIELEMLLRPYQHGENVYYSKMDFPTEICYLLGVPTSLPLTNFVAVSTEQRHVVVVGGYPWEVGSHEVPLLRAVQRHWRVFDRIRAETRETQEAFFYTLETLAVAAEFYDPVTAIHIRRVAAYCGTLAKAYGCDPAFIRLIQRSSVTHDVGKATIPADILKKKGPLTGEERAAMQNHTVNGAALLGQAGQLGMARNIARSHHENYDGTGYPDGLGGEDIPLEARIIKVVDIYDALRDLRSYKPAISHEDALEIMRKGDNRIKPGHFDPKILETFMDIHHQILKIFDDFTTSKEKP